MQSYQSAKFVWRCYTHEPVTWWPTLASIRCTEAKIWEVNTGRLQSVCPYNTHHLILSVCVCISHTIWYFLCVSTSHTISYFLCVFIWYTPFHTFCVCLYHTHHFILSVSIIIIHAVGYVLFLYNMHHLTTLNYHDTMLDMKSWCVCYIHHLILKNRFLNINNLLMTR